MARTTEGRDLRPNAIRRSSCASCCRLARRSLRPWQRRRPSSLAGIGPGRRCFLSFLMSSPPDIERIELAEAVEALSAKEQAFVRALFLQGSTGADAARPQATARQTQHDAQEHARIAFRLRSRPSVVRAIVEECQRTVKSLGRRRLPSASFVAKT